MNSTDKIWIENSYKVKKRTPAEAYKKFNRTKSKILLKNEEYVEDILSSWAVFMLEG